MNERIKQLAEQARMYALTLENRVDDCNDVFEQKFAELLFEDMHKKVIASILITDVVMEEKNLTPTSEDYIRAINKDFGVTE